MTQETKHTPLQSLLPLAAGSGNDAHLVFDAEGDEVFSSNSAGEENAFIVRACNSHYELLAVLEKLALELRQHEMYVLEKDCLDAIAKGAA